MRLAVPLDHVDEVLIDQPGMTGNRVERAFLNLLASP